MFSWRSITRFDVFVIIALADGKFAQGVQREVCIVTVKFLRRCHVGNATLGLNWLCSETLVTELRTILLGVLMALWMTTLRVIGRRSSQVPLILWDFALPDIVLNLQAFSIFGSAVVRKRLICYLTASLFSMIEDIESRVIHELVLR